MKSKICIECGKEFTPANGNQKYCKGPHTSKCEVCGSIFEYTCSPNEKSRTCSRKCQTELQRLTAIKKYGVENVSQIKEVRKKISDNHKSDDFKNKVKDTCQRKYGVDNPAQADEVRDKLKEIFSSDEFLNRRKQTCLDKYGVESPMQVKEILEKRDRTCIEKYGSIRPPVSRSFYERLLLDESKVDKYLEFKNNPKKYIESNYTDTPSIYTLCHDLGCSDTPIYEILINNDCRDLIVHSYTVVEDEVYNFIKSLDPDIDVERNTRKIIKPYELDLYIPEYKLGIEINPAATHNSSIGFRGDSPKHYKYHQNKSLMCQDKGVFLFHIFGYEWKSKQDIIKSMIINLLGKNKNSYGARNTYICNIASDECRKFLDNNHRQGYTTSKIKLGLRHKDTDELLSVMLFSNLRPTMGKTQNATDKDWELSRFATNLNCNVAGGANKLFKYFIRTYNPKSVISFSDVAHTKGTMYAKLGFNKMYITEPNYFWTTQYDTKYLNRVSTQKSNLSNLFNEEVDLNKTEKQIMEEHGFIRTYDSGVIKWEYKQ